MTLGRDYSGEVSNTESAPNQLACGASRFTGVLHPREVPLGGPRAIRVRRTLPQRDRSLIGAWCFIDHYGPHDVRAGTGMDVPPHPHTEVSRPAAPILHGVQLWVALPDAARDTGRDFVHYAPPVRTVAAAHVRVFIGELGGVTSPVGTFTALLGAQVDLPPGAEVELAVDPAFEHGVLLDQGEVVAGDTALGVADLWYQSPGNHAVALVNVGDRPARVLLLGGIPFGEQLVMWWNFVGRSHQDIVDYRRQWEDHDDRFGAVAGYPGPRLPAPRLPNSTLLPRHNP